MGSRSGGVEGGNLHGLLRGEEVQHEGEGLAVGAKLPAKGQRKGGGLSVVVQYYPPNGRSSLAQRMQQQRCWGRRARMCCAACCPRPASECPSRADAPGQGVGGPLQHGRVDARGPAPQAAEQVGGNHTRVGLQHTSSRGAAVRFPLENKCLQGAGQAQGRSKAHAGAAHAWLQKRLASNAGQGRAPTVSTPSTTLNTRP